MFNDEIDRFLKLIRLAFQAGIILGLVFLYLYSSDYGYPISYFFKNASVVSVALSVALFSLLILLSLSSFIMFNLMCFHGLALNVVKNKSLISKGNFLYAIAGLITLFLNLIGVLFLFLLFDVSDVISYKISVPVTSLCLCVLSILFAVGSKPRKNYTETKNKYRSLLSMITFLVFVGFENSDVFKKGVMGKLDVLQECVTVHLPRERFNDIEEASLESCDSTYGDGYFRIEHQVVAISGIGSHDALLVFSDKRTVKEFCLAQKNRGELPEKYKIELIPENMIYVDISSSFGCKR